MVRKLALSLAIAAAMGTTQALALGLGEIRVNSALNEPLAAEIQLIQVRDLSPLQIRPRMADVDEFSLAGLTKSRFLSDIRFEVQVGPNGQGTISVSSSVPVQEPFLSFLMEVNWPNGRLVREYTLLLDPPVFDPAPVTTVINTPSAPAALAPALAQTRPAAPAASSAAGTIRTNMNRATEVYVDVNDTLYVIARNNRPASDISVEQMMVALQRKNPGSFPTSNINMMKAGTVMALPSAEEARALSRTQAIAEAARQTAAWKAGRRSASAAQPAADSSSEQEGPDAGKSPSGAAETSTEGGESQLTIVAPAEEAAVSANETATTGAAGQTAADLASVAEQETAGPSPSEVALAEKNAELENRLLMTQESVTKVERENADLGEKLDSIQEQLIALQRLIELKDEQMAALQAEMLKQAQATNEPKASAFDDLINTLMQNPLYLGGAGGLLVLILALVALKRRGSKDNEFEAPARKTRKGAGKSSKSKLEEKSDEIPEFAATTAPIAAVAAAGAVGGVVAARATEQDNTDADAFNDLEGDLDDLDLDMDLDLDEKPATKDFDDSPLADIDSMSEEAASAEAEIDSMLDDILDDKDDEPQLETAAVASTNDDLDDLLDSELDSDLGDLDGMDSDLDFAVSEVADEVVDATEENDDDLDGLEFAIDDLEEPDEESTEEAGSFIDESFFEPEVAKESDEVQPTTDFDPEELMDEMMEADARPPEADSVSTDEDLDDLLDDDLDKMLAESAVMLAKEESEASDAETDEVENELDLDELSFDIDDVEQESTASVSESAEDTDLLDESLIAEEMPESQPESLATETLVEDDELDIEALLAETSDMSLEETSEETSETPELEIDAGDESEDLDDLIMEIEGESDASDTPRKKRPGELVEDELTANIAHDLDLSLDEELDEILDSTDAEVELVEEGDLTTDDVTELDSGFDMLDGADEVETKLDLARAYIEMDDVDGARDILSEVKRDGSDTQQAEAQTLLDKLS